MDIYGIPWVTMPRQTYKCLFKAVLRRNAGIKKTLHGGGSQGYGVPLFQPKKYVQLLAGVFNFYVWNYLNQNKYLHFLSIKRRKYDQYLRVTWVIIAAYDVNNLCREAA